MYLLSKAFLTLFVLTSSLQAPCIPFKETADESDIPVIEQEKPVEETERGFSVSYLFCEINAIDGIGNLPNEVLSLLPDKEYGFQSGDTVKPAQLKQDVCGDWRFAGWEPEEYRIDDHDVTFSGIWENVNTGKQLVQSSKNLLSASGTVYFGFGSAWNVQNQYGAHHYAGTHQFLIEGEPAWCIEYDKTVPSAGAAYTYSGNRSDKVAQIIGGGKMNGMSDAAIQATLWNYLTGNKSFAWTTSNDNVDYDSSVYSPSNYACTVEVYSPSDSNNQIFAKRVICTPRSKIKIIKEAADTDFDYLANCPNNYSLKGAVYTIYSDPECTKKVATLTTNDKGKTAEKEINPGTYYVKETSPSPGFALDETIYTARVTKGKTVTITSIENPLNDPVYLVLKKQNARDIEDTSHLDEAEFTICYYDTQADDVSKLTPKYRWIFKTIFNENNVAEMIPDVEHYVSGDDLLLDVNGSFFLPLGTFTIEESKAPPTFARDENIYVGHIRSENGTAVTKINDGGWIKVENMNLTQSEQLQAVKITIVKKDRQSGLNQPQGLATLKDGEFTVYRWNEETEEKEEVGIIRTDENGTGSLEKDYDGLELLPGKYFIKERKAPDGYLLNETEFEVDAIAYENDTALFEYAVEVFEDITEVIILKKDSDGNPLAGAKMEILDETGKSVYSWTSDGNPHSIKGLIPEKEYRIHEIETPDDEIYAYSDDYSFTIHNSLPVEIEIIDGIVSLHTSASFKESGSRNYVADGIAHVIDTVTYEYLYPGREYLIRGELIDKEDGKILSQSEQLFIPEEKKGMIQMEYEVDLDGKDEHDLVVYESLYLVDNKKEIPQTDENGDPVYDSEGKPLTETVFDLKFVIEHRDPDDAKQTVHVQRLYRADMVLYKTANHQGILLNGAYFNIKTSRIKADGTLVEKDLGTYVTGGIFLQNKEAFSADVYKDQDLQILVDTYSSSYDSAFKEETIRIMNLPDGKYYVCINGKTVPYQVAKGSIILDKQAENTQITYTEILAPKGYYLNKTPLQVNVGDDREIERIENYRTNIAIIFPETGIA